MKKIVFVSALFSLMLFSTNLFADGDVDNDLGEVGIEEEVEAEKGCTSHEECDSGYKCEEGVCVEIISGTCFKDTDCEYPVNEYCDLNKNLCRFWCPDDGFCIDGEEYCDMQTSKCTPIPEDGDVDEDGESSGFCIDDWDCENDLVCDVYTRTCVEKCQSDNDCDESEKCQDHHCVPIEDGDIEKPWDVDGDLDEDVFEIPEGYEMPGSTEADNGSGGLGGLTDCEPGQVCATDGDTDAESSGSNCRQTNKSSAALVFLMFAALIIMRRVRLF